MAKSRGDEVTVLETARRLGRRLDSTYRLVWERRLTARKDTAGKWLVSVASIESYNHSAKRRRMRLTKQTHQTKLLATARTAAAGEP
jgi:hypothetical protein